MRRGRSRGAEPPETGQTSDSAMTLIRVDSQEGSAGGWKSLGSFLDKIWSRNARKALVHVNEEHSFDGAARCATAVSSFFARAEGGGRQTAT